MNVIYSGFQKSTERLQIVFTTPDEHLVVESLHINQNSILKLKGSGIQHK